MGRRILITAAAVLAAAVGAAFRVHARDMRAIAITDAVVSGWESGRRAGVAQEAARIAAEAEQEADAALESLRITDVRQDGQGLHVTGIVPPGAIADALAVDLPDMSVGFRWPVEREPELFERWYREQTWPEIPDAEPGPDGR